MKTDIIICGLSETGVAVARAALSQTDLRIVAVHVDSPEQDGKDIGEWLGLANTGIVARHDDVALLQLKADCVVVTPSVVASADQTDDLIIRLLESGKNVISTAGLAEQHSRFHTACIKGNASYLATGMFPHLLLERFALTLAKALQRVTHIRVMQAIDCLQVPQELWEQARAIGLGETADAVESLLQRRHNTLAGAMRNAVEQLNITTDNLHVTSELSVTPARENVVGNTTTVAKGRTAAIALTQRIFDADQCLVTCEEHWYLGTGYQPADDNVPYGNFNTPYRFAVQVEGEPGRLDAQLELDPVVPGLNPLAQVSAQGILAAIRPVCEAAAGIVQHDASPRYQLDSRMPVIGNPLRAKHRKAGKKPYRVVIWGPGEIGGAVTRAALQRDDIEIVGAKAFSPHKNGKDLGELVGIGAIGVKATTSKEAIKALRPDCVIVTPQPRAIVEGLDNDVIELLESGINVITSAAYHNVTMPNWLVSSQTPTALLREVAATTGMARNRIEEIAFGLNARLMKASQRGPLQQLLPRVLDPVLAPVLNRAMPFRATPHKLQAACMRGGSSLHGTGVHPTFMAERIGIQLASLLQEPHHMRFIEAADFSYMPDGMWGGLSSLGFGKPVQELDARYQIARGGDFYYGDVTGNVAHLLFGAANEQVRLERTFTALPAKRDFKVGSIEIKQGCAAALHMVHKGYIGNHHFFTNEECWYLGPEVEFRGEQLPFGNFQTPISYTVEVTGKPSTLRMQLSMDGTGQAADMLANADISSADLRCQLGQAMRQAGVTNPITNATAMAILDAVGPVCEARPGVVIDDIQPGFRCRTCVT